MKLTPLQSILALAYLTLPLQAQSWQSLSSQMSGTPYGAGPQSPLGNTWFASTSTRQYRSTDGGNTWSFADSGLLDNAEPARITKGSFFFRTSTGRILRAGDNSSWNNKVGSPLFYSDDQGLSWNESPLPFLSAPANPAGIGFTAVTEHQGAIYASDQLSEGVWKSTDNGTTWTSIRNGQTTVPFTNYVINSSIASNSTAVLASNPTWGIFRSTDQGTSWQAANEGIPGIPSIFGPQRVGRDIICLNNGTFLALVNQELFRSSDNGSQWTKVGDSLGQGTPIHLATDGSRIFVFTESQKLLESTDNGNSFSIVQGDTPPSPNTSNLRQLSVSSNTAIYAAADAFYKLDLSSSPRLPFTPTIITQPLSTTVNESRSLTLTASHSNATQPITYQWKRNGDPIPGQTSPTLHIASTSISDAGNYTLEITNNAGTVTSNPATVDIEPNLPGYIDYTLPPITTGFNASSSVYQTTRALDGSIWFAGRFLATGTIGRKIAKLTPQGTVDTSFTSTNSTINSEHALSILPLPDGSALIGGGDLTNTSASYLRRVSPTGTIVNSFDTSPRFTGSTHSMADAGNGMAYIAGNYGVYRISTETGEIDNTFNPPDFNDLVRKIAVTPDGKIYVAGEFTSVNGLNYGRLARLNTDGSIDPSFTTDPGNYTVGFNQDVYQFDLQDDGKIVAVGNFTSYRGTPVSRIARILSDGSIDPSFTPPTFQSGATLNAVAIDAQGGILVGGSFTNVNGNTRVNLARLQASDGSLDTSFPGRPTNTPILSLTTEPGGNILVGTQQSFYRLIGHPPTRLRLAHFPGDQQIAPGSPLTLTATFTGNLSGTTFQWFLNNTLIPGETTSTLHLANLQAPQTGVYHLVATTPSGDIRSPQVRVSLTGAPTLVRSPQTTPGYLGNRYHLSALATGSAPLNYQWLKNGNPIPGQTGPGLTFTSLTAADVGSYSLRVSNSHGSTESSAVDLAVLPRLGSFDSSFVYGFDPKPSSLYETNSILALPEGKFLAGGYFVGTNDTTFRTLVRLLPDGTVDPTWDSTSLGINGTVRWLFRQSTEKIIVGSDKHPIRLNPDLSPDPSFTFPDFGNASQNLFEMILLSDDSLLVQASANNVAGYSSGLFRTTPNGGIDTSFPAFTFNGGTRATALAQDTDGGILIAGTFSSINGNPRQRIARLTPTFTLDPTFTGPGVINSSSGGPPTLNVITRGPDGKVYVAGSNILTIDSSTGGHIFRLDGTSGTHDPSYYTTSYNGSVHALKFLPDHRLVALGNFRLDTSNNRTVFEVRHPNGARDFSALGDIVGNSTAVSPAIDFIPSGPHRILAAGNFGNNGLNRYVRIFSGNEDLAFTTQPTTSTPTTPANTVNLGSNTTLTATALGTSTVSYQWFFNQQPISGATSATLARNPITKAHEGTYHVVATNQSGSVTSLPIYLDVLAEPEFLTQPTLTLNNNNGSATLTATVKGRPTITYSWTKDGTTLANISNKITGATTLTLTISAISQADAGAYRLVATNTAGTTTSEPADLLYNLSPGAVDPSWTAVYPNNNNSNVPLRVLPTPDGGFYLAGGDFATTSPSGPNRRYAIKYNANGTLDTTFAPTATTLASFPNRISFTNAAGELFMVVNNYTSPSYLYRYSPTGTLTALGTIPGQVNDAFIDANGKLVTAGMSGFFRRYLLDSTSITQDPDFSASVNNFIYGVYPAANGYYIAGGFSQVGGQSRFTLARVTTSGAVDPSFTFDPSGQQGFSSRPFVLEAPNGKVHFRNLLLENDGSRNSAWNTQILAVDAFQENTLQRGFYDANGYLYVTSSSSLRRLLPGGTLDPTFSGPTFSTLTDFAITTTGSAYLAGNFNGSTANYGRPDAVRIHLENPDIGISQPHSHTTASEGSSVTFTATTYGQNLTHQWFLRGIRLQNGGRISGANSPSLTIQNLTLADAGSVRLLVTNPSGSATHTAFLSVEPPTLETFNTWSALASLPADQRDFNDDPDGDGIPNGIEFALGLAPGNPNGSPSFAGTIGLNDLVYPTITFQRRKPLASVSLNVQAAADLLFTTLLPTTLVSVVDNLDGTETVTVRTNLPLSGAPSQFLRIQALPQ